MSVNVRAPEERTCEQCGRHERFDDDAGNWRVGEEVGEPYCVHAWDITGSFRPVEE